MAELLQGEAADNVSAVVVAVDCGALGEIVAATSDISPERPLQLPGKL
jgi:hypothetical protein